MKAKYCYCKNTYTINKCNGYKDRCRAPYYWEHGIGDLSTEPSTVTKNIRNED